MKSDKFWKNTIHENLKKVSSDTSILSNLKDKDYSLIKRVYQRSGGSWVSLSSGSPEEYKHIRKCCKVFLKKRRKEGKRPYG